MWRGPACVWGASGVTPCVDPEWLCSGCVYKQARSQMLLGWWGRSRHPTVATMNPATFLLLTAAHLLTSWTNGTTSVSLEALEKHVQIVQILVEKKT